MRTLLLTCFGTGLLRPASGTWGSMPCAGMAWILLLTGAPPWLYFGALAAWFIVFCVACVVFGEWAEAKWGKKDAGQIVADEAAGQAIPLALMPLMGDANFWQTTLAVGAAFLLFRFFDIVKVPPAYKLQRLRAGWGVLIDDLVAGLYAAGAFGLGLWAIGVLA